MDPGDEPEDRLEPGSSDLSPEALLEQAPETASNLLKIVVENATDMISLHDPEGVYTYVSPAATDLLGYAPEELVGRNAYELFHPEDLEAIQKSHESIIDESAGSTVEYRIRKRDGTWTWFETTSQTIRDPETNEVDHVIAVSRDVTDRKEREAEAHRRAAAQARITELEQVVFAVSHTLRTPLRTIVSFLQLIDSRDGFTEDPEVADMLETVNQAAGELRGGLDALLQYAEDTRPPDEVVPVDLDEVVADAIDQLDPALQEALGTVDHGELPTVEGDRGQLARLFRHVIENAIKFCGKARVRIQIDVSVSHAWATVSVRDDGPGVDPRYAQKVFGLFQQLDPEQEDSGLGVGLTVCRRIVENHGGRIWIENPSEGGTAISFTLPIDSPPA